MTESQDRGLVSQVGPMVVDWPRTVGYYSGVGVAIAIGLVDLPVGIFIAAVPLFKMLDRPNASLPERAIGQLLEGASKPVGGDAEAVVRLGSTGGGQSGSGLLFRLAGGAARGPKGIWDEARQLR